MRGAGDRSGLGGVRGRYRKIEDFWFSSVAQCLAQGESEEERRGG